MEGISMIFIFVMAIFGILNIILFFKIWGMTDDVSEIRKWICRKEEDATPREYPKGVSRKSDGKPVKIIYHEGTSYDCQDENGFRFNCQEDDLNFN